jgi:serine/threonine protein kinase
VSTSKIGVNSRLGNWILVETLGAGGNGVVWRARHIDDREAALKILKLKVSPSSKAYRRFKAEVASLRQLACERGVLPIIEHNLPERPTASEPPWLVMPIATEIGQALGVGASLMEVVFAIRSIARTLASLHERGFVHRDIKPGNLYFFDGDWCVGDFGLVKFPGREPLTVPGEKIGPQNYLAPEMLSASEDEEDQRPADVYSLMKTLYVLATGQRWPTPGPHRVDEPSTTVSAYVNHPRAAQLDVLLERGTKMDPRGRLTMAEVVGELDAWLSPPETLAPDDLTDVAALFATKRHRAEKEDDRRLAGIERARESFGRLAEHVHRLEGELRSIVAQQELVQFHVLFNNQIRGAGIPRALVRPWAKLHDDLIWINLVFTSVRLNSDTKALRLYSGVIAQLLPGERMIFTAGHFTVKKDSFVRLLWTEAAEAALGSALQVRIESELVDKLRKAMRSALQDFFEGSDQA